MIGENVPHPRREGGRALDGSNFIETEDGLRPGRRERSKRQSISVDRFGDERRFEARPPRILYASNVASFFHKFLLPYADHFRENGWQVDALSNGFEDYAPYDLAPHFDRTWEIDWARKPHELRHTTRLVREIRAIAKEGAYDLIHVHTPVAAMMTRYALRLPRHRRETKILYTAHGFHFFAGAPVVSGAVYKRLEQVASRWTDYLVVMNDEDHASARALRRIPEERIRYMPGIGVDLDRYRRGQDDREETRRELGLDGDHVMLLCVAEFIPRKRQADILHALHHLKDRRFRAVFAGEGETLGAMKALAIDLGLQERTMFLGLRLDVPRLLGAADGCVLPSSQEGLPRSVMEAMCNEVPVIATDIRGTRELVGDGAGRTYPVGDVAALASAIQSLADDPESSLAGIQKGLERVEKYDLNSVLQMHEDLYLSALGASREQVLPLTCQRKGYLL